MSADVFGAVADPTRRHLLELLIEAGTSTATELAAQLTISRQAVSKHLAILSECGIARSEKVGRRTVFEPHPEALSDLTEWVTATTAAWDNRLDRLAAAANRRP